MHGIRMRQAAFPLVLNVSKYTSFRKDFFQVHGHMRDPRRQVPLVPSSLVSNQGKKDFECFEPGEEGITENTMSRLVILLSTPTRGVENAPAWD
jgi:hypothetical protein